MAAVRFEFCDAFTQNSAPFLPIGKNHEGEKAVCKTARTVYGV